LGVARGLFRRRRRRSRSCRAGRPDPCSCRRGLVRASSTNSRARLRQLHGEAAGAATVIIAHIIALALVAAAAWARIVPALAVAAFLLLAARAVYGFKGRRRVTAKRVGVREILFGAMTVAALVIGHYLT
jgi:hypothetical protein